MITSPLRQYRSSVNAQSKLARERQHLEHASELLKEGRPERARASEASLALAEIRERALWHEFVQGLANWGSGFATWPELADHGERLWWLAHINHRGTFPFTQGIDPAWEAELKIEQDKDIEIVCALESLSPTDLISPYPQKMDMPVTRLAQSLLSALSHVPMQSDTQVFDARVHLKITGPDQQQLQLFAQLARKTWAVMLKTHFHQGPKAQQLLVLLELTPSDASKALAERDNLAPLNQTPWEALKHLESATWDAMDAISTLDSYGVGEDPEEFVDD